MKFFSAAALAAAGLLMGLTPNAAERLITPARLLAHIKTLSSDEFEGRAPSTKGEELTVQYFTEQFRKFGLKPGNLDGTYVQEVPLFGVHSDPTSSVQAGGQTIPLKPKKDIVAWSIRPVPEVDVKVRMSSSSATALWLRSMAGTTTRVSTSKGRPSSCW